MQPSTSSTKYLLLTHDQSLAIDIKLYSDVFLEFTTLANMSTTSAISIQDEKFRSLGFSKAIVNQEQVNCYSRALGAVSDQNPILALIHGYPQSSYM